MLIIVEVVAMTVATIIAFASDSSSSRICLDGGDIAPALQTGGYELLVMTAARGPDKSSYQAQCRHNHLFARHVWP